MTTIAVALIAGTLVVLPLESLAYWGPSFKPLRGRLGRFLRAATLPVHITLLHHPLTPRSSLRVVKVLLDWDRHPVRCDRTLRRTEEHTILFVAETWTHGAMPDDALRAVLKRLTRDSNSDARLTLTRHAASASMLAEIYDREAPVLSPGTLHRLESALLWSEHFSLETLMRASSISASRALALLDAHLDITRVDLLATRWGSEYAEDVHTFTRSVLVQIATHHRNFNDLLDWVESVTPVNESGWASLAARVRLNHTEPAAMTFQRAAGEWSAAPECIHDVAKLQRAGATASFSELCAIVKLL